jgi:hypothetical protein
MPAVVWYIIVLIASVVISYLLAPSLSQKGPTAGELQAAMVDSSNPVPVLFGTRRIDASNCVWYGDVSTTEIKSCSGKK